MFLLEACVGWMPYRHMVLIAACAGVPIYIAIEIYFAKKEPRPRASQG